MNIRILLLGLIILGLSCKTEVTEPSGDPWSGTPSNWVTMTISQTDYDSLVFSGSLNPGFLAALPTNASLRFTDNRGFTREDTLTLSYEKAEGHLTLTFHHLAGIPGSVRDLWVTLRFHSPAIQDIVLDTLVALYKYPYPSAEILIPFETLATGRDTNDVQDFTLCGRFLYFHPKGWRGLFRFDMLTRAIDHYNVYAYVGGDFMASDSLQAYADVNAFGILRHDLSRDTTDLEFDFTQLPFGVEKTMAILGIHLEQHRVLTMLRSQAGGEYLVAFDRNGRLLSYFRFPVSPYYLAFDGDVAYSYSLAARQLIRYDTLSRQLLAPRRSPSNGMVGLRIYGQYLYYVDESRSFIGRVQLDDIRATH